MERREKARAEREWDRDKVREFGKPADEKEGGPRRSRSRERRRKERGKSKEKKGARPEAQLRVQRKLRWFQSHPVQSETVRRSPAALLTLSSLQRNLKNLLPSCWMTCSAKRKQLLVFTGFLSRRSR